MAFELCRILFASSGGIHFLTYILKIECYGYLFVYYKVCAHTHIRARIKSQPSHLTHSLAQCLCVATSCCLLSHCRCGGCIRSRTARITNCKKSNNNNIIDNKNSNADDLSWLTERDERKQAKGAEITAFFCSKYKNENTHTHMRGFTWKRILMDNFQAKKNFKWFYIFSFSNLKSDIKWKAGEDIWYRLHSSCNVCTTNLYCYSVCVGQSVYAYAMNIVSDWNAIRVLCVCVPRVRSRNEKRVCSPIWKKGKDSNLERKKRTFTVVYRKKWKKPIRLLFLF